MSITNEIHKTITMVDPNAFPVIVMKESIKLNQGV